MKLKPWIVILLAAALAASGVASAQALGIWKQGEGKRAPSVTADGAYRVDDIKGSYSFAEVETYFEVPVSALAEAFGVSEDKAAAFQCKDVASLFPEENPKLSISSVKAFVAFYRGLPVDLFDGTTYLPVSAANVIKSQGTPTEEQRAYLETHTFDPGAAAQPSESGTAPEEAPGNGTGKKNSSTGSGGLSDAAIEATGSSYFTELSGTYNIPAEDFMAAFNMNPEQYAFFQLKDVKNLYANSGQSIGPNSVKLFIALYGGYHIDLANADTYLPASAAAVLEQRVDLSAEQKAYLEAHLV